jgi:hypothetical protein
MISFNLLGKYGRFGNQLFQYATLFSIAKTNNYNFGIPHKNVSNDEYQHMCLFEAFDSLSAKDSSDIIQKHNAVYNNSVYNAGIFGVPDETDICGYFQSEKFFKKYRNLLLKEFLFKKEILNKAEDIRSISKYPAIAVHFRIGDYAKQQHNYPLCTEEYYFEAFSKLPDDLIIFVFSDDIEKASTIIKKLNRPYVLPETNDKYIDMCLMNICDYHIIANSSFSWWGSWLSNSKKTIAPSQWYGANADYGMPKNWSDIYCDGWEII